VFSDSEVSVTDFKHVDVVMAPEVRTKEFPFRISAMQYQYSVMSPDMRHESPVQRIIDLKILQDILL
jgi:hypothetical protein